MLTQNAHQLNRMSNFFFFCSYELKISVIYVFPSEDLLFALQLFPMLGKCVFSTYNYDFFSKQSLNQSTKDKLFVGQVQSVYRKIFR